MINAVGIDVSKGFSTVAVVDSLGEVTVSPFNVNHTVSELGALADKLKCLKGETKVVMEATGNYYLPIANALHAAGLKVYAVNPILIKDFGNNAVHKRKSDKADSMKIGRYAICYWRELPPEYVSEEEIRHMLKSYNRQYNQYVKIKTMLTNNLISLLDQSFPGLNKLFTSPAREKDGHEKWVDFAARFWHCGCVASLTQKVFKERYVKWCKRSGYYVAGADEIYTAAQKCAAAMPHNKTTEFLITTQAAQINAVSESIAAVAREMKRLAELLPEYPVALEFFGVGDILGSQLAAEVGDVLRFEKKSSLVSFAGLTKTVPVSFRAKNQSQRRVRRICEKRCSGL